VIGRFHPRRQAAVTNRSSGSKIRRKICG
jgi:hypothetical protein